MTCNFALMPLRMSGNNTLESKRFYLKLVNSRLNFKNNDNTTIDLPAT
jgi:hypothetical protein